MVDWAWLIREALVGFWDVYRIPDLPERKVANARVVCRVPADENVVALLDRTILRSAKHAVVYGERAIYIRDRVTEHEPDGVRVIEYLQLPTIDLAPFPARIRRTLERLRREVELRIPPAIVDLRPKDFAVDDIGRTPEALALQEAIAAEPRDEAPQLVLADLLMAADDPRGELIVLHQRETTEGLRDPDALERYLLLGALYSFPRAEPEQPVLGFFGTTGNPGRYSVVHDARDYTIYYADGGIEILIDGTRASRRRLKRADRHELGIEETALMLRYYSDAIRAGTPLQSVQLPFGPDPLPTYDGGPVRCYRVPVEFTRPRGLEPNELGLAARDYHHWLACWRRLARLQHPSSSSFADV